MNPTIHKTAEVSLEARIGSGTKIWQNAQVAKDSVIGENCVIGHNCAVFGAKLGNSVKLQANTDVWEGVVLEDFVFIGPSAVFTNDPNPRAKYPKKDFPQYGQWLPTLVKEGASIGANATVICSSVIGKWAFVGAGAVVKGHVPDYAVVAGVPAKQIGWMCECGNKLEFKREKLEQQEGLEQQERLERQEGREGQESEALEAQVPSIWRGEKEIAECGICKRQYEKQNEMVVLKA